MRLLRYWLWKYRMWRDTSNTGGNSTHHVCSGWTVSKEENGEYIAASSCDYWRADTMEEAYREIRRALVFELRMFREMYVDDIPDYKGRD